MAEGVDYAWSRPTVEGLVAAGKAFACRYVGPGSAGKHLDEAEARTLSAAGISIVANAEGAADGLRLGWDTGVSWARSGHEHATRCGMPPDRPIYLSCDFDVTSTTWPKVAEGLRGAGSVIGPGWVGVYGGYDAVAWAARDGVAAWYWQTYAWSEGRWHPAAHIQQYRNGVSLAGGSVDLDRSTRTDFGQWTTGETMAISPEDLTAIADAVLHRLYREYDPGEDGVRDPRTVVHTIYETLRVATETQRAVKAAAATSGLSEARVRAIIREEIDKTRLAYSNPTPDVQMGH